MTPHLDSEIMPQNDLTSTLLVSHTVFTFVNATLVVAEFVKDHDLGNLWTDQLTQQAAQDLQEANTVSPGSDAQFRAALPHGIQRHGRASTVWVFATARWSATMRHIPSS